ncbi:MAG: hypothetical protein ACRERU_18480, partial [Methylococcales bacterium]
MIEAMISGSEYFEPEGSSGVPEWKCDWSLFLLPDKVNIISTISVLVMIKAGIIGGTGYTGVELLRILSGHPNVAIRAVTSRSDAGLRVSDLYPNLRGKIDVEFKLPEIETFAGCDVIFFATPNGTS